jgi:hypothetical protein
MTRAQRSDERTLMAQAEALVLEPGTCGGDAAVSRVRALAPPPERAAVCGALRALDAAKTEDGFLVALVALHFDATAALWTLAIHEGNVDPDRAAERTRPILPIPPEREARIIRLAAARPLVTLGAGLAAELLTRDPSVDPREAARRWLTFGDAPLDVVEAEVFRGAAGDGGAK